MNRSVLLLAVIAAPLQAQTARPDQNVQRAIATITEADYRQRIGVLAHDSMRGRGTPSPELEEVATWIASEFQRWGLRPGGDNGTFLQRYRMRRYQIDTANSFVMAMGGNTHAQWQVGRDAAYAVTFDGATPEAPIVGPLWVMAGPPADTARPFAGAPTGAVVMYVPRQGLQGIQGLAGKAKAAGVRAIVGVLGVPRAQFNQSVAQSLRGGQLELVATAGEPGIPLVLVHDSSVAGILRGAGEDLAALRGGQRNGLRALGGLEGTVQIRRNVTEEATAPNVIGVLEGSDPRLRNEYVVYSAHMDHVGAVGMGNGCGLPRNAAAGAPGDSICNGADDDASGTTGVIMLAQAFARMNPRPRRSMVFMLVSGEERGLWGSEHYSENPTLPLAQTVANINLDMIGRNWRDTISVIGKEHSTLGETANRVTREHPELGMNLVDDLWPNENFYRRSDHFNFARKGVPILFFFNGVHGQYHQVGDHVDQIDAEKASRIVKMAFYIGVDVANTTERPQWNPASRASIVQ